MKGSEKIKERFACVDLTHIDKLPYKLVFSLTLFLTITLITTRQLHSFIDCFIIIVCSSVIIITNHSNLLLLFKSNLIHTISDNYSL